MDYFRPCKSLRYMKRTRVGRAGEPRGYPPRDGVNTVQPASGKLGLPARVSGDIELHGHGPNWRQS